ncbi:FtsX-like permease family protein [Methylobacillus flagellatus]|uniref:ABC transporter permease n=1 Tax=Methylobacillus flagellatus TaxID=405 RepID=UPI002853D565|nr:FtsX-like permease family protein [Methylobacillus flagellatus]MDR5171196.1 FtsX-like permease family protein [Methylobacillus flagellatus]
MTAFLIAWRQLRSQWAAGEVRVLVFALVLAVAATTSVGFFTDRIESALVRQGGMLLGGDILVAADHAIPDRYIDEARQRGLQSTHAAEFPSMVLHGDDSQLAEIKAVGEGFPLRGELTVLQRRVEPALMLTGGQAATGIPAPGTVWIEPRLASKLGVNVGDSLEVGERNMQVSAILQREPSRGGDMFSIAPRVMLNAADLASTGLIQFGSRVKYQLLLAGEAAEIDDFAAWLKPKLERGEQLQKVTDARPEMRNALEKAQQFLGLSAMVSVILAMVAMFLASQPYVQKSLDSYALMRCFGASRRFIFRILMSQTLLIAAFGSGFGVLLGFAAQAGLAVLADRLLLETLPAPGIMPAVSGLAAGFAAMLAVVWPHLARLRDVPALRILRRDLGEQYQAHWLHFVPALLVLAGLILWQAGDAKLGAIVLLALAGLLLAVALLAWLGVRLLARLPQNATGSWLLGLAALKRRPGLVVAQVLGFSLGLTALILLAIVRGDLLSSWQQTLPEDAPNRFIINIQPEQIRPIKQFFDRSGLHHVEIFPMVRGRLLEINGKPLNVEDYQDDRARRLAEREFNLSWTVDMQQDNQLLEGHWWQPSEHGKPMLSLEQGIANDLRLKLGDRLTYDVAGTRLELEITSLRKVEWDTMRANFFAVTPPGVLDDYPASYITSFHLPGGQEQLLNQLVREFPNLTVIDVAALLDQVREIMNKMSHALEYVFAFSLLTGLAVLYAALVATREERVKEATLLRVLGASRRQVLQALWTEFAVIGILAALVATLAAAIMAYYLSSQVFNIPYQFNLRGALGVMVLAALLVPAAAWLGMRRFLNQSPRAILQSI